MACFIVPAAEAAIVTIATHVLEKKAIQKDSKELSVEKVILRQRSRFIKN
ncbi:hypothetical protein [Fibrobacter intestinalis]|nr:hypothetical protein [Fibrobacter intestinalis]MDD7299138.1 hypothetical protein [Fibrobacter intestinalis]